MIDKKSSRRKFLKKASLVSLATLVGYDIVFAHDMPENYKPLLFDSEDPYILFGKHHEMTLLNDKPWNMEAKAHLLNHDVTPEERMFIRNNGIVPKNIDPSKWSLKIDGESVTRPVVYSLQELKEKFQHHTYLLTLECAGNGRSEFNPPAKGNQWTIGAVSCAKWTGVRLKDILAEIGLRDDAMYIGYYGSDGHLSGQSGKNAISRGVPLEKAMMDETLIAFQMNGEDIPLVHGYPLRLIAGGWPASASGKWLNRISVRNKIHDGAKMGGQSYRVPCEPVAPGSRIEDENMCIIESMPVKSLITYPKTGAMINAGQTLKVNGHAWAGELEVVQVEVSIDFGTTWQTCHLAKPVNRLAWQHWSTEIGFPKKGYYEVWARATDSNNQSQPMVVPGWNSKGYLNNACHRIAVKSV